jgi:hypothetical protein
LDHVSFLVSFSAKKRAQRLMFLDRDKTIWTTEIRDAAASGQRNDGICWFMGDAANSTKISWIVPPAWSKELILEGYNLYPALLFV